MISDSCDLVTSTPFHLLSCISLFLSATCLSLSHYQLLVSTLLPFISQFYFAIFHLYAYYQFFFSTWAPFLYFSPLPLYYLHRWSILQRFIVLYYLYNIAPRIDPKHFEAKFVGRWLLTIFCIHGSWPSFLWFPKRARNIDDEKQYV